MPAATARARIITSIETRTFSLCREFFGFGLCCGFAGNLYADGAFPGGLFADKLYKLLCGVSYEAFILFIGLAVELSDYCGALACDGNAYVRTAVRIANIRNARAEIRRGKLLCRFCHLCGVIGDIEVTLVLDMRCKCEELEKSGETEPKDFTYSEF